MIIDHTTRRVVRLWQLGERIENGRAALLHPRECFGHATTPLFELRGRVARMRRDDLIPVAVLLRDDATHPFRDERILRLEVAVQRHLVRAGRLRDRLDADTANAHPTEEIVGRGKNPFSGWHWLSAHHRSVSQRFWA